MRVLCIYYNLTNQLDCQQGLHVDRAQNAVKGIIQNFDHDFGNTKKKNFLNSMTNVLSLFVNVWLSRLFTLVVKVKSLCLPNVIVFSLSLQVWTSLTWTQPGSGVTNRPVSLTASASICWTWSRRGPYRRPSAVRNKTNQNRHSQSPAPSPGPSPSHAVPVLVPTEKKYIYIMKQRRTVHATLIAPVIVILTVLFLGCNAIEERHAWICGLRPDQTV